MSFPYHLEIMDFHPSRIMVDIVGTNANSQGRCCEEHDVCGEVLTEDTVVRFRQVQVCVQGKEETALAVYHVSDGIDRCRVGFLPRHLVKHWRRYHGVLAQVTDVYTKEDESKTIRRKVYHNKGFCTAAIIGSPPVFREVDDNEANDNEANEVNKPNEVTKKPRKKKRPSDRTK